MRMNEGSAVQALREKRTAEQPGKKKRKRADDEDEDASSGEELSDSDDAVGV